MHANTGAGARPLGDELYLGDILVLLRRRIRLLTVVGLVAAVISAVIALLMTPIYRAEALLSPTESNEGALGGLAAQFGGLADLAGVNIGLGTKSAVSVATLRSRALTETFIAEEKLLPVLFYRQWDAEAASWKKQWFAEEGDEAGGPTLWHAFRYFDKDIRSTREDRKTGLVTLAIEWKDPVEAARWANELVRRTNATLQREAIDQGQKTITYLEEQLAKARSVDVQQALSRLIETETKKVAVAHSREQYAFKIIDPAVPPKRKVRPFRTLIVLVGTLLSLIGAATFILLTARRP
jgi:uncharacterized protein involved in exopolysaccharide biosynthesis